MAPPSNANETTKVLSYVLVALLAFCGGYLVRYLTVDGMSKADNAGAAVAESDEADKAEAPSGDAEIPIGDSPVLGPEDAPVTIVEFSDFECPFCQKGYKTLKKVQKNYPEKVRVVFKNYPLPMHSNAKPAARAALAAEKQGKFWKMHDKLFEKQKSWKKGDVKKITAGWAKEMGLDVEQFKKDFDKDAFGDRIQNEMKMGKKLGVKGTPHFFINGEALNGAQPYNKFKSIIDDKLDQAKKLMKGGVAKSDVYEKAVAKNFDSPSKPSAGKDKGKKKKKGKKGGQTVEMVPVEDHNPMRGASTDEALVTIVEFSEFQCPFCEKVRPTLNKLKKNYGDKVRFVFKHRPLRFHKQAEPAAKASIAAQKQGKFWEMHDLMFEKQSKIKKGGDKVFVDFAKQIGLNVDKFKKDMESSEAKSRLQSDTKLAGKVGAKGTPTFFVNGVKVTGAQPYNKFKSIVESQIDKAKSMKDEKGVSGDKLYETVVKANKESAGGGGGGKPSAKKKKKKKKDPTVDTGNLSVGDSPVRGPEDAELTIYEFSDFECPYCKKAHPTVQKVMKNYEGDVKLVHKQYPLPFHDSAKPAAKAAIAAQNQGKYWEMYDKMFKNQGKLGQDGVYEKWAEEIGLNVSKFKKDMKSSEADKRIKEEMKMGKSVGVKGTPAFIIGEKRLVGAQPYSKFKSAIESQLGG